MSENLHSLLTGWIEALHPEWKATSEVPLKSLLDDLVRGGRSADARHITKAITSDETLEARFISAANTFGFNPLGLPIRQLDDAVTLFGDELLRELAIAIVLHELIERSVNARLESEICTFSLTAGVLASEIVHRVNREDRRPTIVYATLRQYGRALLVAFLLLNEEEVAPSLSSDADLATRFGMPPYELSVLLARAAQLPKALMALVREHARKELPALSPLERARETALATFCELQTCAMLDVGLPSADFGRNASSQSGRLGEGLGFGVGEFLTLLNRVQSSFSSDRDGTMVTLRDTTTYKRLRLRAAGVEPGRSSVSATPSPFSEPGRPPAVPNESIEELGSFLAGISRLTQLLAVPPVVLDDAYHIFLQTVYRGLDLNDAILFSRASGDLGLLARHGIGNLYTSQNWNSPIHESDKSILGIALSRREEIWIPRFLDREVGERLPSWFPPSGVFHSIVILPVDDGATPFALLFGARRTEEPLAVNMRVLQHLKALRIHLVTAFRLARE